MNYSHCCNQVIQFCNSILFQILTWYAIIKQPNMINMFIAARIIHGNLEKSFFAQSLKITLSPINKNHGVRSRVNFHLNNMIATSWINPQTTKVNTRDNALGKIRLSGLNIYFPRQNPQIGFQYCQNIENFPAPRERINILRRESLLPNGTPFLLFT